MTDLDALINAQKEKLSNSLLSNFSDNAVLGFSHTLADCDYYDNNRWFPEDGLDWTINLASLNKDNIIPAYWDKEVSSSISAQIRDQKIIDKNYGWGCVSPKYFQDHQCGFFYMSDSSFKFYLAAFINLYLHDAKDLSSFSGRFFGWISQSFNNLNDKWFASLEKGHIYVIIDFLIYIVMLQNDDSFIAESSLKKGWLNYDGYGQGTLEKYYEEKMIQDFVERE